MRDGIDAFVMCDCIIVYGHDVVGKDRTQADQVYS